MPTYEYACSECGNAWEEIQKITAPPVELCPACGKSTAKRQISGGNFILKGGGWYSDLYSSAKPAAKDDSAAKSGEGGSGKSEKTETKSDAKTDGGSKSSEPKKDSGSSSGSSSSGSSSGSGSSGSSGSTKAAE